MRDNADSTKAIDKTQAKTKDKRQKTITAKTNFNKARQDEENETIDKTRQNKDSIPR